jgi:hypothetical protein
MYLNDITDEDFQIKKRKTTNTNYNRSKLTLSTDIDYLDTCHLDLAFKKLTTSKKRKNIEIDNITSSISKPARNAKVFYSKYENFNTSISKPNLL